MTSVTLDRLWINLIDGADSSTARSFQFVGSLQSQPQMQVSSRVYADGRARLSYVLGRQAQLQVTLRAVSEDDRVLFEFDQPAGGWLGRKVWFRDDRGRKLAGFWAPPQIIEHQYNAECDISLTITEVFEDDLK